MRNYRVFISSNRKHFLVDLENNVHYFLMLNDNTYFAKEAMELRTVEEGIYYHFDRRYILCSEDLVPYIYE